MRKAGTQPLGFINPFTLTFTHSTIMCAYVYVCRWIPFHAPLIRRTCVPSVRQPQTGNGARQLFRLGEPEHTIGKAIILVVSRAWCGKENLLGDIQM